MRSIWRYSSINCSRESPLSRSFCRSLASSLSCLSFLESTSGGASMTPVELCCSSALAAEGGAAVCLLIKGRIISDRALKQKQGFHAKAQSKKPERKV